MKFKNAIRVLTLPWWFQNVPDNLVNKMDDDVLVYWAKISLVILLCAYENRPSFALMKDFNSLHHINFAQ